MSEPIIDLTNFTFKPDTLYSESTVTDCQIGQIMILTPINSMGFQDPMRATVFNGKAVLLINGNKVPIIFRIEANDLNEAINNFPLEVKKAVEQLQSQALRHQLAQPTTNTRLDLSKLKN